MNPSIKNSNEELFDSYLADHQVDLQKIIGKHRYSYHHLDAIEMLSEVNLSLIKKKDDIIEMLGNDFCRKEFNKVAYNYARNCIKWSHGRLSKQKYYSKRLDVTMETSDGPKTSFESAVETEGYEEEYYESFDGAEKYKYLIKFIKDYSYILTPTELKVFSLLEQGKTHEEISEECEVTRQAVSACCIDMFEKIKFHLKPSSLEDDDYELVSKGSKSINNFFTKNLSTPMDSGDRASLAVFLKDNPKSFTTKEVAEKFMDGKYNTNQILANIRKNGLSFYVRKSTKKSYPFTKEQDKLILSLFKEGKDCKYISQELGIPLLSITGKRGHFSRKGMLPASEKKSFDRKFHFSDSERSTILELFKDRKTSYEISELMDIPLGSIAALRGYFVKKGFISPLIKSQWDRRRRKEDERLGKS